MYKEELKQEIISKIKWEYSWNGNPQIKGGQTVSISPRGILLTSEESDFKLFINYYRSSLKNKELAFTLFKLYLDEIIT